MSTRATQCILGHYPEHPDQNNLKKIVSEIGSTGIETRYLLIERPQWKYTNYVVSNQEIPYILSTKATKFVPRRHPEHLEESIQKGSFPKLILPKIDPGTSVTFEVVKIMVVGFYAERVQVINDPPTYLVKFLLTLHKYRKSTRHLPSHRYSDFLY